MSKIGALYLDLQEEADEKGFESVEAMLRAEEAEDLERAYEQAHQDWLARRHEALARLDYLKKFCASTSAPDKDVADESLDFIKDFIVRGEV